MLQQPEPLRRVPASQGGLHVPSLHRPTSAVRGTAEEILGLLQTLNQRQGKTVVTVTHDPRAAAFGSGELYVDKGALVNDDSRNAA